MSIIWEQPRPKEYVPPEPTMLLVNTRGRVVEVKESEVEKLQSLGFAEAPKKAVVGTYIAELDALAPKPEPKKPAKKKATKKKK